MNEEMVPITSVFDRVLHAHKVDHSNEVERDARYSHIVAVICDELRGAGRTATLVSPRQDLPPLDLPVSALESESTSSYLLGAVGTVYYRPDGIRYVDWNSRVFIPATVGEAAAARAMHEVKSGQWLVAEPPVETPQTKANDGNLWHRAIVAAYRKRFPEGHEDEGIAWKAVPDQLGLERLPSVDTVKRALGRKKKGLP